MDKIGLLQANDLIVRLQLVLQFDSQLLAFRTPVQELEHQVHH
jgi:hypothetical protein